MKKETKSEWVLVDIETLPARPGVEEVQKKWLGQEIWFRMPKSGNWRRGKVKYIDKLGAVRVVVYQEGTLGLAYAFDMKHIPVFLKPAW